MRTECHQSLRNAVSPRNMFSNCRHSRLCRQPFVGRDTTVGIVGRKKLGMLEIWTTSSELSTTSPQNHETIGNTQFLEKQMEFVPIEILLIVFLFFLYSQESTYINYI